MKQLIFCLSLMAILAVGCNTATDNKEEKPADTNAAASNEAAKPAEENAHLLVEVDKDGLESTLVDDSVTLVEFTATW